MLTRSELNALTQWCHGNARRWMPAVMDCGRPAMMLEHNDDRRPWKRLFLVLGDDGFCLLTEKGETFATASELPAVLDAISDGIPRKSISAAPTRAAAHRHVEANPSFVF